MTRPPLASGYRLTGISCGIKPGTQRRDLALIVSTRPASAAGVFTQNRICAAPVQVCRERLPARDVRGVVVCAGNANACTGAQGLADARRMTELAAAALGCEPRQMLVASTGVIGRPLPMPAVEAGIAQAAAALADTPAALDDAAHAILTTDTHAKLAGRTLALPTGTVHLTALAKGAAMIGPNLATMLAFILSDAAVTPNDLQAILGRAADRSFNCISVEGHTSTNDTVLLLANGPGEPLAGAALQAFAEAVEEVCIELARAIVDDAEGATHTITLEVSGAADDAEARLIARTIANSPLVKTAIHGADPNWGRVVSAAGYAGVPFAESELSLWLGELPLYLAGVPQPFDPAAASAYLRANRTVHLRLTLQRGAGTCRFWTSDLTAEYVRLNADYTT
jgi:glutamate N-acetyltransferase/amino-acid N-acetyltransferase